MEVLYKSWDSKFFGLDIFDILIDEDDLIYKRTIPTMPEALLQANVSISEYLKITQLLREGFSWVNTTVCFRKALSTTLINHGLLLKASNDDIEDIRDFIPGMYTFSRFHCEKFYPCDAADKLYDEWLVKASEGSFDDGVHVYKEDGKVGGFITYRRFNTASKIGLIGVNPEFKGRGIGSKMMASFEGMCVSGAIREILVDTQLLNNSAIMLYVRNGYDICDIRPWMYRRG